jgi:phosphopantetheinyl transferase
MLPINERKTGPALEREQLTLSNVQIDSWGMLAGASTPLLAVVADVLSRYAWQSPGQLRFFRGEAGKVYLSEDVLGRPLYFDCARTSHILAMILAREPRIGIEIVRPEDAQSVAATIEQHLSESEREPLAALSDTAAHRALLSLWTRKRALQKANACAGLSDLGSIVVGMGERASQLPPSFGWVEQWQLHTFTMRSGEIGTIAVARHERLLVLGAFDRRRSREGAFRGPERRRRLEL